MVHSSEDMKKWKREQINYFKKYLTTFREGTKEYNIIRRGISELENGM
jgi:hypothetical protein